MNGGIQQRGKYKHEIYERGREICWSGFLGERKMVEYGWEGLFLGRMLDSSPMPADARSAQYDQRTMCRRVSWLIGRPWLQPLLICATRYFLKCDGRSLSHLKFISTHKQNLDERFSVRKGTMGNNLKPYSRGGHPLCVCVTWWNSSTTQLFMIGWIIKLYTRSLFRRFVLTKLRVIPKGSFSGFEDLEKM